MDPLARELELAVASWDARGWPRPQLALVGGSGLDLDLGASLLPPLPLSALMPFPVHAVPGHALAVELLQPAPGRLLLYFRGRLHCYQGFDAHQVAFPVRLAVRLGAAVILATNAAGSLRRELTPGSLAVLTDHINLSGLNPLRGDLPASWGERFPALDDAYDPDIVELARHCARREELEVAGAVYAWLLGPSYETPTEIAMLRAMGADLVGMSTVPEILAGRQMGARCAALSLVTNLAAGLADHPPDHEEVLATGRQAGRRVRRLLAALLRHPDLV